MRLRFLLASLLLCLPIVPCSAEPDARPNIVWILADDMSAHFSCYGETTIRTPHVDALASAGTRFSRAFVTAPICSISRSALVTGCYQTSNVNLADFLRGNGPVNIAKTDYNLVWDRPSTYDHTHWTGRSNAQPFFAQVQLNGGKHRGQRPGPAWPAKALAALGSLTPTNAVKLPPYLPEDDKAIVQAMRRLHAEKKLTPEQSLIMADTCPREELYDLASDPHELRNLATDPKQTAALAKHRAALADWITRTDDLGRRAEPEEIYLDYIADNRLESGRNQAGEIFKTNTALMLRWATEKPMDTIILK